jgi:hypothetical protein
MVEPFVIIRPAALRAPVPLVPTGVGLGNLNVTVTIAQPARIRRTVARRRYFG